MLAPHTRLTLFQNRWLEKLTVISASTFIALWAVGLPAIAWAAWSLTGGRPAGDIAAPLAIGGRVMAGLLLWTLTEYALHRFVFHWKGGPAPVKQFVFLLHGNHHSVPGDRLRNLMPPIVSLPIGGTIWTILAVIVGAASGWVFLGFMSGYVAYDMTHYACHQWPMKGRMARMLKTHHMRHHHAGQAGNYAITGMMWDRLFGTRITSLKPAGNTGAKPRLAAGA